MNKNTLKNELERYSKKLFFADRVETKAPRSMHKYHFHNSYELYYLYSGERYYFIKDKMYHVTPGDLVFINEYDIHCTTNVPNCGYDRVIIDFKKEFLEDFLNCVENINLFECFKKEPHIVHLDGEQRILVETLFKSIIKEQNQKNAGYDTYLKSSLLQILYLINRNISQSQEPVTPHFIEKHNSISEIAGYINNHFDEDITLDFIAQKFFISPHYFSRNFKKTTGFSFIEYLNNVRTKEAQRLLFKSNLTVSEISRAVGYKSTTHFGRVFKTITGVSPLAYRKINRN